MVVFYFKSELVELYNGWILVSSLIVEPSMRRCTVGFLFFRCNLLTQIFASALIADKVSDGNDLRASGRLKLAQFPPGELWLFH